jgi:hypothetical protein
MLQGEAKTAYMREYMRRKRAGLPTVKPKKEWEPSQRMIREIEHWAKYPKRTRGMGRQVINGLTLDNDTSWMEACRRYKAILDKRWAEAKERKRLASLPPPPKCCSFCGKPQSSRRILVGDRYTFICQQCATKAVGKARQARKRRKS